MASNVDDASHDHAAHGVMHNEPHRTVPDATLGPAPPSTVADQYVDATEQPTGALHTELPHEDAGQHNKAQHQQFDPIQALKLGSLRLANMMKGSEVERQASSQAADAGGEQQQTNSGEGPVARLKATAVELSARAKQHGSRFYQASVKTAATTAEAVKRLATGEPVQVLCRSELTHRPAPQLVLSCCCVLVAGGGCTTERIFKHNPPQELVERLAAAVANTSLVSVIPPGTSPHAVAALLKQFLLGFPEPLLTYRLLPQWVAAGDHPAASQVLLQQLPPANANTLQLLLQTCHYINEHAATNEMDAQALAEVLVPCLAWNPPPKTAPTSGPAWQGLSKALSMNKQQSTSTAVAADETVMEQTLDGMEPGTDAQTAATKPPAAAAAANAGDSGTAGSDRAAGAAIGGHADAQALYDAQQEALVTVLEFMITNYKALFI